MAKITKVEYYDRLTDNNIQKETRAKLGIIASLGIAGLFAVYNASNLMQVDGVEYIEVLRGVLLSIGSTVAGMLLNGSLEEQEKRKQLANDYATITLSLRKNDGAAMAKFLQSKYPGIYNFIENQVKMKYEMENGGKTL